MYGTIARIKPKEGKLDEIVALMEEWDRDYKPDVEGAMAGYLFKPDDGGDPWMVAVFENREAYRKNAEDPAQDAWYRRLREALEADPDWIDGEYLTA